MNLEDIEPGKSYACRFEVACLLDKHGVPVAEICEGARPGTYTSLGVIVMRDTDNKLVKVKDVEHVDHEYVVSWENCWDVDEVEWQ